MTHTYARLHQIFDANRPLEQNMRQAFQGTVLAVAVGVQLLTFYSVLYA